MIFWNDPINFIGNWLHGVLVGWGMTPEGAGLLIFLISAVLIPLLSMLFVIFLIWYERKLIGRIQDRFGPNRVGPWGIIQPIADMLKIFTKEYITPKGADWLPFNLGPILAVGGIIMIWAVIPFSNKNIGVDLNVGALYIVAVGAIGTLGIILAGLSSNNKYAMLSGFRMIAQMVSYEVPMVLSLLIPVILSKSMGMNAIVQSQNVWYIAVAPVAAFIYFLSSMAEVGRSPFDIGEAESEIVAGFNIEYSGLKFGMFYVGEFMHAFTISLLFAVIFLGGWQGPSAAEVPLLGFVYLTIKTFIVYLLVILFRGTLPRMRIDQMMDLNWKKLTPVSLVLVMATAIVEKLTVSSPSIIHWAAQLGVNLIIILIAFLISRRTDKQQTAERDQFAAEQMKSLEKYSARS
jgi:NADH-quinone oxidoreductase subunit H